MVFLSTPCLWSFCNPVAFEGVGRLPQGRIGDAHAKRVRFARVVGRLSDPTETGQTNLFPPADGGRIRDGSAKDNHCTRIRKIRNAKSEWFARARPGCAGRCTEQGGQNPAQSDDEFERRYRASNPRLSALSSRERGAADPNLDPAVGIPGRRSFLPLRGRGFAVPRSPVPGLSPVFFPTKIASPLRFSRPADRYRTVSLVGTFGASDSPPPDSGMFPAGFDRRWIPGIAAPAERFAFPFFV
jgi:hypothetical protein